MASDELHRGPQDAQNFLEHRGYLLPSVSTARDGWDIYFLGSFNRTIGGVDAIKVGAVRRGIRIDTRIAALQTGNPNPIVLLARLPYGGMDGETAIHHVFRDSRLSGEWFAPTERLCALIEEVCKYNANANTE